MSFPESAAFLYDRHGDVAHIQTHGLTNHELRAVLIGFWLTLALEDRADHIKELRHYLNPKNLPPPASIEIAKAVVAARDRGN